MVRYTNPHVVVDQFLLALFFCQIQEGHSCAECHYFPVEIVEQSTLANGRLFFELLSP